jgi:hypothetical protein
MTKTCVYIDGFNLYYGSLKTTKFKWLDLTQFCQSILPNDHIDAIKYFTAKVSGESRIRQELYLRALGTLPKVSIHFGQFLEHPVRMRLSRFNSCSCRAVSVLKREEKGSDVNLASYLLHDGFLGLYDVAVIVSNDSDLREPVRMIKEVLKLPIGIINPHATHSKELQEHATFVKRVRTGHLSTCQFPAKMTDAKGAFGKPKKW